MKWKTDRLIEHIFILNNKLTIDEILKTPYDSEKLETAQNLSELELKQKQLGKDIIPRYRIPTLAEWYYACNPEYSEILKNEKEIRMNPEKFYKYYVNNINKERKKFCIKNWTDVYFGGNFYPDHSVIKKNAKLDLLPVTFGNTNNFLIYHMRDNVKELVIDVSWEFKNKQKYHRIFGTIYMGGDWLNPENNQPTKVQIFYENLPFLAGFRCAMVNFYGDYPLYMK
jgi:hypothetical protein